MAYRLQPTMTLVSPTGVRLLVKPKALWVIGANGRVDLYLPKGAFALVDIADQSEPAQWTLYHIGQGDGQPFVPAQIADMARLLTWPDC